MEDRISELPDLVLSSILSNLTLKDVIKTTALSKGWKKQHRHLIHKLNFDMSCLIGSKYDQYKFTSGNRDSFEAVRVEFIIRVNQVLNHFKGSKISSFKVCFFMDSQVSSDVDSWISSAIAFRVEQLQLLFAYKPLEEGKLYEFPYWLSFEQSFLKHLSLETCILRPPSDFTELSKLITLRLLEVTLGQEFTSSLFKNCTLLQELTIINCKYSLPSSILRIVSTSLHKLTLFETGNALKVEISAINLVSFECKLSNYHAEITSFEAPSLANSYFLMHNVITLLTSVSNLEILTYIINPKQAINKVPVAGISAFRNLKQLWLVRGGIDLNEQDSIWVLEILKASPLLQKFHFTSHYAKFPHKKYQIESDACRFTHKNLKQVEIDGCTGNWHEIQLVLFILKNAIALERVTIDPSKKINCGDDRWLYQGAQSSSWIKFGRDIFQKLLQNNVPEGVQLVIL